MKGGCRKRTYESRRAAKAARRRHIGGHGFETLRPYYCEDHEGWHLGHLSEMVVGGWETRLEHFAKRLRKKAA